ncbi:MAG: hypothetical protein JNL67_02185 [Planctomycetaceae bacterium]|nr:hypothetical protein [Planctomycetaceae bacterium]
MISNFRRIAYRYLFLMVVVGFALVAGCPAPTPGERIVQLNGRISDRGNQVIDLDLSGTSVTDNDMGYIHGLCSNSRGKWRSIHTLNLSNTAITDRSLEMMAMQNEFSSPGGLQVLILTGTNTSAAAIQNFQQAAPNCQVQK